jgi:hypothetical protein
MRTSVTHYYIRYETFQNDTIAYDLTGDELKSGTALDIIDIPFYTIEQILGADSVCNAEESVYHGARDWLAWIKATDEQVEAIKRLGGPFIQWLTLEEYNEVYGAKHPVANGENLQD